VNDHAVFLAEACAHSVKNPPIIAGLSPSIPFRLVLLDKAVCDLQDQHGLSLFFNVPQLSNAGGTVDLIVRPGLTAGSRETLVQTCAGSSTGIRGFIGGFVTSNLPDEAQLFGGVNFPAGASSFADRIVEYDPAFGGGPVPDITSQDARQILGVPGVGDVSLGNGGRIIVRFLDNRLTGSNDSQPDLWIFEVGAAESTFVEISKNGTHWISVGTATGFASGIDIDHFGFGKGHHFAYVRLTDDGDSAGGAPFVQGADLVAVGASSSVPPVGKLSRLRYTIQAHVGGLSRLIIRDNTMQWHHIKGTAPGLVQADVGRNSNSPTIVDSNQGPNIPWVPSGWPVSIGNGTHPESLSNIFSALTPVFPAVKKYWKLEQSSGDGKVRIIQQPDARNGFSLVIEFDDLKKGGASNLSGSGFYTINLTSGI